MSEFRINQIYEQEITVDGDFKLPFHGSLLVSMINHNAAKNEDELNDMINPKNMIVKITISTKEI